MKIEKGSEIKVEQVFTKLSSSFKNKEPHMTFNQFSMIETKN